MTKTQKEMLEWKMVSFNAKKIDPVSKFRVSVDIL